MTVEEVCTYRPYPDNDIWTSVKRETIFESSLSGLKRVAILKLGFERYKYNIKRADSGFQQVIGSFKIY